MGYLGRAEVSAREARRGVVTVKSISGGRWWTGDLVGKGE